jgi:hypothetical protein
MNHPIIKGRFRILAAALVLLLFFSSPFVLAQQKIHEEYTKQIRKFTTDPHFSTKYVNYLPYASGVPTPLEVIGHIAGAADVLSYSADVYKYMRALDAASPRVKVFNVGKTEEGRDWIVVAVADEKTIASLDRYKQINGRLADPRKISESEAQSLIRQAKPIYWATGGMHSGETGSVEMLMELAYRVAVDDSPFIRTIRDNAITLITPILEVDGRDRQVDIHMAPRKDPKANVPSRLIYWGKYVAHDNNRDNLGLALALSRHILKVFFDYHPQVMHDLHESISHLYISTGTGPYNAWLDPIVVDEWHQLAYQEVNDLTRQGVPGVWTHGFYDGWAPNYAFYAANGHNSIGRFYETQGAGNGSTRVITARGSRDWYRPNPPLARTLWSIRNNVNLQQSAILVGMNYVAANRTRFMENFWLKSKRSVAKARAEGPAAYVFPGDDPRPGQVARLLQLLQLQGVEIHRAEAAFKVGKEEFPAGSYIIRMDQPYSRMADLMLDKQYFNVNDPRPYDDVGWTMGPLFNIRTVRVEDVVVLDAPMTLVKGGVKAPGGLNRLGGGTGTLQAFVINHNADNAIASFLFKQKDLKVQVAEKTFEAHGKKFNAGSFILRADKNAATVEKILGDAGENYGFMVYAFPAIPEVALHELVFPRIALMHTWQTTQTEGWVRTALDEIGVPYDYIDVQAVRDNERLRDQYDVILFGPSMGDPVSIIQGVTGDKPQPWKKTDLTPNLGLPVSTDDMRGGLEFEGLVHLRDFVKAGGVFIALTNSSQLPIHFGLAQGISIKQTPNLWARGGVFKADIADAGSPIVYGYGDTLGVYFSQAPVFASGGFAGFRGGMMGFMDGARTGRVSGRGTSTDPDIPQGRPRDLGQKTIEEWQKAEKEKREKMAGEKPSGTPEEPAEERPFGPGREAAASRTKTIIKFTADAKNLLISGGLANGEELAGTPALVDSKLGDGHIVMFSFNPMWRHQTHGSFFLVFNAMLNWKNL